MALASPWTLTTCVHHSRSGSPTANHSTACLRPGTRWLPPLRSYGYRRAGLEGTTRMKNRPPNVFISSTMYDLRELRAQLRQFVEGLGWRPVMSEHDSFPINPDQSTVENSRRNVRENADIFVMVVGARYGSVDADADKSVTNLEFVEARARGTPAYVFVSRDVLAQLEVWQTNPEADYSSVVDTPRVFEFIESFPRRWRDLGVRIHHRRGHREHPASAVLVSCSRRARPTPDGTWPRSRSG